MPNPGILQSVSTAWTKEAAPGKKVLDLSCGSGVTSEMLAKLGFRVTATDYSSPPPMSDGVARVGGVDLVEVIEHIENQPQLLREISRVLKPGATLLVSTPNVLNVMSRVRFLFTGFLRGRVRPAHYTSKPGQAPNIYLLHFYELYYLLFHYGFEIVELRATRVKFASRLFLWPFWPWMWISSLVAVIHAEKGPIQRRYNWQILSYLFHPALLLSDNIVVKARKADEDSPSA